MNTKKTYFVTKFTAILLVLIFAVCFAFPVFATDETTDESGGSSGGGFSIDFSDMISGIVDGFQNIFNDAIDKVKTTFYPELEFETTESMMETAKGATRTFDIIRGYLVGGSTVFLYIDTAQISRVMLEVFLPLGYVALFISWCVQAAKGTLELELLEGKAFIKIGSKLIIGIVVLSFSTQLLELISGLSTKMTAQIIDNSNMDIVGMLGTYFNSPSMYDTEEWGVFSFIPMLIKWNFAQLPVMLLNIGVFITAIIISFSLGIRCVKLGIFQGVAPLFFGLSGSDATSRYCQNFIVQYCALSFQIVIMSAMYNVFQYAFVRVVQENFAGDFSWTGLAWGLIILAVFSVMMCKSDRIFDRVLN